MRLKDYLDPENATGFMKQTAGRLSDAVDYVAEDPKGVAAEVWDGMHPMDKFALATAPIPVVGEISGLAADARMYYEEPESRTPANYMMTATGMIPFVPPAIAKKPVSEIISRDKGEQFEPRATIDPTRKETMVSARYPTAVNRLEDPDESILLPTPDTATDDFLKKNLSAVTQYPGMKGRLRSNSKPERVMDEFMNLTTSNMQRAFDEMPSAMRDASKEWYEGANKIRGGLASHYNLPKEAVSGVIAALSPQNPWDNNLSAAERMIDTHKKHQSTKYTPEMEAQYKERSKKGPSAWDKDGLIDQIRGKKLSELETPKQKAAWIRLFDEAHNPQDYEVWSPTGSRAGVAKTAKGADAKFSWGSFNEMAAAVNILDDPTIETISKNVGSQHKVRNFYNNIENPNADLPFYTSDTHNVSAALLRPLGGSAEEVTHSFGGTGSSRSAITGHQGTYPLYHQAGILSAANNDVLPREMQSITWESIRNIFTNKSAAQKAEAEKIWNDYGKGRLTLQQAQDRIIEAAGGFKNPSWLAD